MIRAFVRKEWKMYRASSVVGMLINPILFGGAMLWVSFAKRTLGNVQNLLGIDCFFLFGVMSMGLASLVLFQPHQSTTEEIHRGILNSLLAYTRSPKVMILSKAIFVTVFVVVLFLFWSGVGVIVDWFFDTGFITVEHLLIDAVVGLLIFPLFIFTLALVQVLGGYLNPQIAPVINILFFGIAFVIFSNLADISGHLGLGNLTWLVVALGVLVAVVAGIVVYLGRVSIERIVMAR